jgi:hypothetical protein
MRIRAVVTLLILALPVVAHAEQPLCPPRVVGPNEPEELLIHENDFSLEKAQNSVNFLRTDFAKRIWGPDAVKDFGASSEHYISYANSLRFIEGALLKERALHLRAQSQLLAPSGEARAAQSAYENAKKAFCTFVQNSIYVD